MGRRLLGAVPSNPADAVPFSLVPRGYSPPSGSWALPINVLSIGAGSALTSGTAYFFPLGWQAPQSFQSLGCNVTTAQSGGTVVASLGLYGDDGTGGQPALASGPLASGTVTLATLGKRTASISYTHKGGHLWTAFLYVQSVAPGTVPIMSVATNATTLWCRDSVFPTVGRALSVAAQSALPTTAQTLIEVGGSNGVIVGLRGT